MRGNKVRKCCLLYPVKWNLTNPLFVFQQNRSGKDMNDKIEEYMDTSGAEGWEDEGGAYVIPEKDKIIKVNTKTVKCDNDHPVVWYSLAETGFAVCGYCNIKYALGGPMAGI